MTLFLGELPLETEYTVWDLFMVEGSKALFWVCLTVLKLMEKKLKIEEEKNGECSIEETMMILMSFSK